VCVVEFLIGIFGSFMLLVRLVFRCGKSFFCTVKRKTTYALVLLSFQAAHLLIRGDN